VFEEIAAAGVFIDMIVQSAAVADHAAILSLTVPKNQLDKARTVAEKVAKSLGCKAVTTSPDIAKLSVSGVGLRTHTSVGIRMFKALAEGGINIEMINTSEVRVNVAVDGKQGQNALKKLQEAFADVMG
jgi:aspartate kinase